MSFAILGATGQVGSSILQVLTTAHPDAQINVLVRSRAKLERTLPSTTTSSSSSSSSTSSPALRIFEGPISDIPLLTACIRNTTAVFLTVATATNIPHTRIARDQVEAVAAALDALRREQDQPSHSKSSSSSSSSKSSKLPTLVMLSSAETEERFVRALPRLARRLLFQCNYWIYTDLLAAEAYLRARSASSGRDDDDDDDDDNDAVVFFKPGGISHDVQTGHVLSEDESMTFVSFLDVAAGMVECAVDGERWRGKSVSVLAAKKARFPVYSILVGLPMNLLGTWFPWLYTKLF